MNLPPDLTRERLKDVLQLSFGLVQVVADPGTSHRTMNNQLVPAGAELFAALEARPDVCTWAPSEVLDGVWVGGCRVTWALDRGTPMASGMNFCPSCGKPVVVVVEAPREPATAWEITPRPLEHGGGWNAAEFKDGVEVAGGVFPICEEFPTEEAAHLAASEWVSDRGGFQ